MEGRAGDMKLSADIIDTGIDKLGEYLVPVGSANEFPHGDAKFPGIIGCENIPEVACGDHHIHKITRQQRSLFQQFT
jgi:hypothetical protein